MISIDTETTGLDLHHGAKPYFVTICKPGGGQIYWEWPVNPYNREPQIPREDIEEILHEVMTADGIVFQNGKFDVAALNTIDSRFGKEWPWDKCYDTIIAGHLLASNRPHNLTDMAIQYLGWDIHPFEENIKKITSQARRVVRSIAKKSDKKNHREWRIANAGLPEMPSAKETTWKYDMWLPKAMVSAHGIPFLRNDKGVENVELWLIALRDYANTDSAITLALITVQIELIKERGLWEIFLERLKIIRVAYLIESRGVTLSRFRLNEKYDEYQEESKLAEEKCKEIASTYGHSLVLPKSGMNKSLSSFCFSESGLNLPVEKRGKKSEAPSLDKEVMSTYELELPPDSDQSRFIKLLASKRKRDTAINYMDGYKRFARLYRDLPSEEVKSKEWVVLHPFLNPTGTATLRWSSQNPNEQNVCFDGETEVLTSVGWVMAASLTSSHRVAQYWSDSGLIDFVIPSALHSPHFKGEMVHITTKDQIDLLLTPAHRCLVESRRGVRRDVRADEFVGDYKHIHAGKYVGGTLSLSEDEVIWLCAVQADGSYCKIKGEEYGITFAFKKERKIIRLRDCLQRMGVTYSETVWDNGATKFYIGKNEAIVCLAKSLMPDKNFGPWLLAYDSQTLETFSQEILNWDGSFTTGREYSSSIKENTDWVQILWSLCGRRAREREFPAISTGKPHYVIGTHQTPTIYSWTTNFSSVRIPWDGPVYCVTVPSGYLLVRRNGKVSVTGNSKQEGFNLRYSFGPVPGREWWSLDAKNIELRLPAYRSGEEALIAVFDRPDDPPYFGSYHLVIFDALHPEKFAEHGKKCKDIYESTWYQWVKNGNFALLYGCQEAKADLTYRVPGAYKLLRDRFPKIAALSDYQIRFAENNGFVETIPDKTVNPKRGYPLLCTRTEYGTISPTVPLNYHIQGSACYWMCKAMVRVQEFFDFLNSGRKFLGRVWEGGYYIVLQVHDELVPDMPSGKGRGENSYDYNLPIVKEVSRLMSLGGEDLGVPTPTGISYYASNWSDGITLC